MRFNMKTFKDYITEQLITEIGDTPKGREALARYSGRAKKRIDLAVRRAFEYYDKSRASPTKRGEQLNQIGVGGITSKSYNNRIRGVRAAMERLKQAPPEEVERLNQIFRLERGL